MRRRALLLLLVVAACNQTPSARAVTTYVGHLHAGRHEQAYAMLTADARERLPLQQWKQAMHTQMLADAQSVSVSGIRSFDPGGTCVYTQLDFVSHPDQGPYGHYIFYLQDDGGTPRIAHVQTYDRIEGEGMLKTTHFDKSREPFACSSTRP